MTVEFRSKTLTGNFSMSVLSQMMFDKVLFRRISDLKFDGRPI